MCDDNTDNDVEDADKVCVVEGEDNGRTVAGVVEVVGVVEQIFDPVLLIEFLFDLCKGGDKLEPDVVEVVLMGNKGPIEATGFASVVINVDTDPSSWLYASEELMP